MGSEHRDWYRDWWRKKTGYVERAGFRVALGRARAFKRPEPPWLDRLILPAVLTVALCLLVLAAFRLLT